ncbi:sulfite exporter TauE/SafE family protein [Pontibacterium granulatum]|uniref:sulfite exporter TauE/SafE family protein n=1 Tax=Pontibacterium granulatum TaxID=2036029 RepID=UPI00249B78A8|nr:sulfite exporter TauE/SafE family protein [Pontibacterium granulatum]MDI3325155.1 sulfite exporter TauE/SafE family protein [Pontibacterium granulatum]
MILTLLMYLVLGAVAGVVAGLFGIGGGLLIVPVLIFSFSAQGMSPDVLTHAAVATSLATIVVTSISSVRAHHKRGAVRWDLFKPISLGILLGAFLGVKIAGMMPGSILQMVFGVFALCVAAQMAFGLKPSAGDEPPAATMLGIGGTFIGSLSAVFGIGGGTLTVPFLTWKQVQMQQAVATSAACGLPIALMGAMTNVWEGWGNAQTDEWSLGYVYLPAFAGIVITSSLFAKFGARLAHSLPAPTLKRFFAVFLLCVGTYLIGKNLF